MDVRTGAVIEHIDGDREEPAQHLLRDLMDPAALEARLVIARARRAEVLAAKAKGSRDARDERRSPLPPGDITPDALMPLQSMHAVEAAAGSGNGSLPFPLAAGMRKPPAANEPLNPVADNASIAARQSVDVVNDLDRRTPVHLEATSREVTHPVTPSRAPSRTRRSATLVAATLLSGVALGAVFTLILQLQGWQIAIVPPAADGVQEQLANPETVLVPVETAEAERAAVLPSDAGEHLAFSPSGSEASVTPPLVTTDPPHGLPNLAFAAEVSPAMVARPALGEPISVRSVPALAPAQPLGSLEAQLTGLLQPAPVQFAVEFLQTLSSGRDAPALPTLPGGAEPEQAIFTGDREPRPILLPMPDHDVRPSTVPQPPEAADPSRALVSSYSRVAVHYPPPSSVEADAVSAELTGAGFADVSSHPVSVSITSPHVRFYYDVDRAAAEDVASLMSAALGGAAVETRSFTDFRPLPEEGLVEVWLAGEAPPSVSRPAAAPSRETVASRRATAREAERQRLTQAVEELLRARLQ